MRKWLCISISFFVIWPCFVEVSVIIRHNLNIHANFLVHSNLILVLNLIVTPP
jgi:hypothetical protein